MTSRMSQLLERAELAKERRPSCALCRKPVDEVSAYTSLAHDTFTWVFRCHGDYERVELTRAEAEQYDISLVGQCFTEKRIAAE